MRYALDIQAFVVQEQDFVVIFSKINEKASAEGAVSKID